MSDILAGRVDLDAFKGLVACGGFSYGDVLGAGELGPSRSSSTPAPATASRPFFARKDSFALGVCNGCQMMSNLHELIPGTEFWPHFVRNRSEQFEARVAMVQVQESSSIFLQGMAGSRPPIAIAHGEGHAEPESEEALLEADLSGCVSLRFVDNHGKVTEAYPANPNGSPRGITGLSSRDGRVTIMMPHPSGCSAPCRNSWRPTTGRKTAAGCACSATPGSGWTDPAWRAMRTQLAARPSSRGSPGLSRRHLAAHLRGFGFASRLSRRLPQRPDAPRDPRAPVAVVPLRALCRPAAATVAMRLPPRPKAR
ncbi:phosphoribosylformylglycinamidine synthase subunit PurQ [Pseudomonas aeruginosa]|nr:phosphoribosylformylglycinamidine synthase subunit PurQ [Pseudomonas aeruginosa]